MLDHILLLCDEVERPFLTDTLLAAAPGVDVRHVRNASTLADVEPGLFPGARLVGFGAAAALPPAVLGALGFGAYNFHPGPPAYPGWMPAAFAVYDEALEFGATAHAVSGREEGGAIIGIDTFPVAPGTSRGELARLAYLAMLALFRRLAPALASRAAPLPALPDVWGSRRTTRALFAALCDIAPDIDKPELLRRVRGLGEGDGYSVPTVWLHGIPFRFAPPRESET